MYSYPLFFAHKIVKQFVLSINNNNEPKLLKIESCEGQTWAEKTIC